MFFTKKKKRRSKRRFVYIKERITKVELTTRTSGRREIKIGVATNVDRRLRQVDRGTPGKVVVISSYKISQATKAEAYLHKLFSDHSFVPKGADKGSGKTEWFKLTNRDIRIAKHYLANKEKGYVGPIFWILILSLLLAYLMQIFK